MYAIIAADGRQLKVVEGQELQVDLRGTKAGEQVVFDRVLAVGAGESLKLGKPTVQGASVTAEVIGTVQGPKLVVQKFRRARHQERRTGHRQLFNRVKITKINAG